MGDVPGMVVDAKVQPDYIYDIRVIKTPVPYLSHAAMAISFSSFFKKEILKIL